MPPSAGVADVRQFVHEDVLASLYGWLDEIPLSRPKRNITRDFADVRGGSLLPLTWLALLPHSFSTLPTSCTERPLPSLPRASISHLFSPSPSHPCINLSRAHTHSRYRALSLSLALSLSHAQTYCLPRSQSRSARLD
jgi:hypothetical protein